ncbi:MAG: hypothetical protein LH467_07395 [Gemmatimonadaceae bacterium]|nr:hypothetical protein [Gemmatimonadaceae bacterium]
MSAWWNESARVLHADAIRRWRGLETALASTDSSVAWLGWRDLFAGSVGLLGYVWVLVTLSRGGDPTRPPPSLVAAGSMSWLLGLVLFVDAWRKARSDPRPRARHPFDGARSLRLRGVRPSVFATYGTVRSFARLAGLAWVPAVPLALLAPGMRWSALSGLPWIGFGDAVGSRWATSRSVARVALVTATVAAWGLGVLGLVPPEQSATWSAPMESLSGHGGPLRLAAMTVLSIIASGVSRYFAEASARDDVPGRAGRKAISRQPRAHVDQASRVRRGGLGERDRVSLRAWARREPVVVLVAAAPTAYLCWLVARHPERIASIFSPAGAVGMAITLVLPTLAVSETLWGSESRTLMGYMRLVSRRGLAPLLRDRVTLLCRVLIGWHLMAITVVSLCGRTMVSGAIEYAVVGASGIVAAAAVGACTALATTAWSLETTWIARPIRYIMLVAALVAPMAAWSSMGGWAAALVAGVAIAVGGMRLAILASERVQFQESSVP